MNTAPSLTRAASLRDSILLPMSVDLPVRLRRRSET
jgi:hypothetical protein